MQHQSVSPVTVVFGYPGGGFRREYFDIWVKPDYSQARFMTDRGFVFVASDHPGLGGSSPIELSGLGGVDKFRASHGSCPFGR